MRGEECECKGLEVGMGGGASTTTHMHTSNTHWLTLCSGHSGQLLDLTQSPCVLSSHAASDHCLSQRIE